MKHECPCQSGLAYAQCCARYIERKQLPQSVEALMRSRYTAYTQQNWNYIYKTWANDSRPSLASLRRGEPLRWLGLKVLHCEQDQHSGIVEFIASFHDEGGIQQFRERSRFVKINGRWLYLDAQGE